jgi:hypothetical protein
MSRAFVKEGDGALDPLPDLPQSPHQNHVTPRGLASLQARLLQRQTDLASLKSRITVTDPLGHTTTYEITGEDEADATLHRIAPQSPLARALLGAQVGDEVTWRRPSGPVTLTIQCITHADPPA